MIRADVTRGSGCGTAVFEEEEEAVKALTQLNGLAVSALAVNTYTRAYVVRPVQVQGCVVGVTMDADAVPVRAWLTVALPRGTHITA